MIDSTTWFIAYFYPRIAVLDDYNGWDRMPFMDSHEFYSDFNDYTVTVNVPKITLFGEREHYSTRKNYWNRKYLKRYKQSFNSDTTVTL